MDSIPVDIVLATNRAGRFLGETLRSVREQSYPHWRLIVVDDGTPDPEAVKQVVGDVPRTTVVRQDNRGLPAARNRGIAVGHAPLIALLDDDDVWAPDKLKSQVAALAASPSAVAAFTGGRYIDGDGHQFGAGWSARATPSSLFISGEIPAPRIVTLMVRRSAHVEIGGFNESYSLAEDIEYILRLSILGEMVALPGPMVAYRRHDGNMSTADSLQGRLAIRRLLIEQLATHQGDPFVRGLLQANLSRFQARSAEENVRALTRAARQLNRSDMVEELRWASRAPGATARALFGALTRSR